MAGRHAKPTRAVLRAAARDAHRHGPAARVAARRRARAWRITRGASSGIAAAGGVVALAIVSGGGTFALWNNSATVDTGTLHTVVGETSMRFAAGDPENATASFGNLLPGESKTIPIVLENDGDLDVDVAAEIIAVTGSGYSLRLELDAACTTSGFLSSPYLTGAALALDTPVGLGAIADGDTATLCVQVTADAGITPSSAMTFDVVIAGDSGS